MVSSGEVPELIYLECDWGAAWPTWVPNGTRNSAGRDRTNHLSLDRFALPDELRERLIGWQRRWESLAGPLESEDEIDATAWNDFVRTGHELGSDLSHALGGDVKVIVRLSERT